MENILFKQYTHKEFISDKDNSYFPVDSVLYQTAYYQQSGNKEATVVLYSPSIYSCITLSKSDIENAVYKHKDHVLIIDNFIYDTTAVADKELSNVFEYACEKFNIKKNPIKSGLRKEYIKQALLNIGIFATSFTVSLLLENSKKNK